MQQTDGKIRKLSYQESLKIAAGQVVERPANVVKELIENAVDAQATKIEIHIEDGGKKKIRVIDNGSGMNKTDAQFCFEKHATSKITHIEHLTSITTYGFRGEALATIAAVSKIALTTKEKNAAHGYKVITQNDGTLSDPTVTGCPEGTDITVENIFYGLPARKKFLKTRETEWRHILLTVQAFCLSYPKIQFKLTHDKTPIIQSPTTSSLIKRTQTLFDTTLAPHLLPIDEYKSHDISITGCISSHDYGRYDRNLIFCLVNKRPVKNFQLAQAIIKGYQNVLQPGKYPAACLFITLPGDQVDINMHPRKEEVKFEHPVRVQRALEQAVRTTLEKHVSTTIGKSVSIKQPDQPSFPYRSPSMDTLTYTPSAHKPKATSSFVPFDFDSYTEQHTAHTPSYSATPVQSTSSLEQSTSFHQEAINIVGVFKQTYIMIEHENGLLFIDQHAAHERILYERLKQSGKSCQQTNIGHLIPVSPEELNTFTTYQEQFEEVGFSVEQFAKDKLIVHASPLALKNADITAIIKEMLGKKEIADSFSHALHARTACAQAVKAGDTLTMEKMKEIIRDLKKTDNRLTCPHGRPTFWLLPIHDITKKFKRDYQSHTDRDFPLG